VRCPRTPSRTSRWSCCCRSTPTRRSCVVGEAGARHRGRRRCSRSPRFLERQRGALAGAGMVQVMAVSRVDRQRAPGAAGQRRAVAGAGEHRVVVAGFESTSLIVPPRRRTPSPTSPRCCCQSTSRPGGSVAGEAAARDRGVSPSGRRRVVRPDWFLQRYPTRDLANAVGDASALTVYSWYGLTSVVPAVANVFARFRRSAAAIPRSGCR
jgi:hypothetical protein